MTWQPRLIASFEPKSPAQVPWLELARSRRDAVDAGAIPPVPVDKALRRIRAKLK
jgi:hypothetical protein